MQALYKTHITMLHISSSASASSHTLARAVPGWRWVALFSECNWGWWLWHDGGRHNCNGLCCKRCRSCSCHRHTRLYHSRLNSTWETRWLIDWWLSVSCWWQGRMSSLKCLWNSSSATAVWTTASPWTTHEHQQYTVIHTNYTAYVMRKAHSK